MHAWTVHGHLPCVICPNASFVRMYARQHVPAGQPPICWGPAAAGTPPPGMGREGLLGKAGMTCGGARGGALTPRLPRRLRRPCTAPPRPPAARWPAGPAATTRLTPGRVHTWETGRVCVGWGRSVGVGRSRAGGMATPRSRGKGCHAPRSRVGWGTQAAFADCLLLAASCSSTHAPACRVAPPPPPPRQASAAVLAHRVPRVAWVVD